MKVFDWAMNEEGMAGFTEEERVKVKKYCAGFGMGEDPGFTDRIPETERQKMIDNPKIYRRGITSGENDALFMVFVYNKDGHLEVIVKQIQEPADYGLQIKLFAGFCVGITRDVESYTPTCEIIYQKLNEARRLQGKDPILNDPYLHNISLN